MLKLDIEGTEFDDVLEALIKQEFTNKLSILSTKHTNILAKKLEEKFEYVKQLMEEDNIKNIYLD